MSLNWLRRFHGLNAFMESGFGVGNRFPLGCRVLLPWLRINKHVECLLHHLLHFGRLFSVQKKQRTSEDQVGRQLVRHAEEQISCQTFREENRRWKKKEISKLWFIRWQNSRIKGRIQRDVLFSGLTGVKYPEKQNIFILLFQNRCR